MKKSLEKTGLFTVGCAPLEISSSRHGMKFGIHLLNLSVISKITNDVTNQLQGDFIKSYASNLKN